MPAPRPGSLKAHLAAELSSRYLARGGQGTTAIEGNTRTTEEVLEVVKWLAELRGENDPEHSPEDRFTAALLSAIIAHLVIAWVDPFGNGNGNGRVARLVEVQILSGSGIVPPLRRRGLPRRAPRSD